MKIFDTHTHYDDERYGTETERNIYIRNMENVAGFIAIGCTLERTRKAIEIAKTHGAYATVGVHPSDTANLPSNYIEILEKAALENKDIVVAVGEIGLDYCHYEGEIPDKSAQQKHFNEQLDLAEKLKLPIIIHSRDAISDMLGIIHARRPKAVMHCFSETEETARELVSLGLMISFTGVLTFKNAIQAVRACAAVPIERLMLETDCPYMAPVPHRGKTCDSGMLVYIAQKIGEIKNLTAEEIIKQCNANAERFFGIDISLQRTS